MFQRAFLGRFSWDLADQMVGQENYVVFLLPSRQEDHGSIR